jgi:hypothetical protein
LTPTETQHDGANPISLHGQLGRHRVHASGLARHAVAHGPQGQYFGGTGLGAHPSHLSVSVFGATLPELGWLLSAWDLSGNQRCPGQPPAARLQHPINLDRSAAQGAIGTSVLSDLGTLQVGFRYLNPTGNPIYAVRYSTFANLITHRTASFKVSSSPSAGWATRSTSTCSR